MGIFYEVKRSTGLFLTTNKIVILCCAIDFGKIDGRNFTAIVKINTLQTVLHWTL